MRKRTGNWFYMWQRWRALDAHRKCGLLSSFTPFFLFLAPWLFFCDHFHAYPGIRAKSWSILFHSSWYARNLDVTSRNSKKSFSHWGLEFVSPFRHFRTKGAREGKNASQNPLILPFPLHCQAHLQIYISPIFFCNPVLRLIFHVPVAQCFVFDDNHIEITHMCQRLSVSFQKICTLPVPEICEFVRNKFIWFHYK